eukprot:3194281-Alexandrium_andersonii.AAC.1
MSQGPGVPAASGRGGGPAGGCIACGAKMGARGTPPSRMPTCSGLMVPYCLTYSSRGGSPTRACT